MNNINHYNDYKSDINGAKYFDMKSIDNMGGFEYPIYFMLEKSEKYILEYLSPDQYMNNIRDGFGLTMEETLSAVNMSLVKKYAQDMIMGDKFPLGFYKPGTPSQEGRHRALAMKELGVTSFPIVQIYQMTKDDKDELALSLKNKTQEEVNDIAIEMGYNGISPLDYRSIQIHLEHRMN